MDITKHLVKPVEVEILGEKVFMKPLRAKHFVLVSKYQYLLAKAHMISKENAKNGTQFTLSDEDKNELLNLELELSFATLSEISPGITRLEFDELPMDVIQEIMNNFWEINDPNKDELEKAKKELGVE
jgi:hypothetical protein